MTRINTHLPEPLARHVGRVAGPQGLYETPSEYVRALIRRDMQSESAQISAAIIEGVEDIAAGRYFQSTGDWEKDKAIIAQKEKEGSV